MCLSLPTDLLNCWNQFEVLKTNSNKIERILKQNFYISLQVPGQPPKRYQYTPLSDTQQKVIPPNH